MLPEPLPEYRVEARNTSSDSENKIHNDATARRYGFASGLVPGVTVYAYLSQPLAVAFGAAWLQRGTAIAKFLKPVLAGEEVRVTGEVVSREPQGGVAASLRAITASAGECATVRATLPAGSPTPVNVALYPPAPLPGERPAGTRQHLASLDALGTFSIRYDATQAEDYVAAVSDPLPLYRGRDAYVHPAFLLHLANRCLRANVLIGPWIHIGSSVRHLGAARVGDTLSARARVRSLWEKKEREYVELDLVVLAGARPVAHVLHSAIYKLPAPQEASRWT